ncbi:MAG: transporter substrate-binding domain-containing protein [Desulfopila sp.]|jgi:polar amino acid transport system substrate-binding protein|nr:transporter substrate-binding domain-containing protein [Desulfopila sp.]
MYLMICKDEGRLILRFIFTLIFALFFSTDLHAERLQILSEEWAPISFSDNGKANGLAVEVVEEILLRLKTPTVINIVPWARGWQTLLDTPNVVLFTMTRTPEREKLFTMIGPVALGTTDFYARKGSGIQIRNLSDAGKVRKIGVYRSAVEEQLLRKEGFTNLEAASTPLQSARMLMAGRIDLWCNANLTAISTLQDAGYSKDDIEHVFTLRENHLYIAISAGTPEAIVNSWLETLKTIKADSTFTKIYRKWLPNSEVPLTTERIGL